MSGDSVSMGSEPPPGGLPHLKGWTIDSDLVWWEGEWCTRWHLFLLLPSGRVIEVIAYDPYPAQ